IGYILTNDLDLIEPIAGAYFFQVGKRLAADIGGHRPSRSSLGNRDGKTAGTAAAIEAGLAREEFLIESVVQQPIFDALARMLISFVVVMRPRRLVQIGNVRFMTLSSRSGRVVLAHMAQA